MIMGHFDIFVAELANSIENAIAIAFLSTIAIATRILVYKGFG